MNNSILHYTVIRYIVDHGYGPTTVELAELLKVSIDEVKKGLIDLADYHGVVLHPDSEDIWIIHPFSLAPTNFIVKNNGKQWWGNCAWCSLGVAALLKGKIDIITSIGAEGEKLEFSIEDGKLNRQDLFIHFPIRMRNAWDNVIFTCSTILIFENEKQVDAWCTRHRIQRGDIQPIENIWEFSKVWYGSHLNPNWEKWSTEQAIEIFNKFNLTNEIWELPVSKGRF